MRDQILVVDEESSNRKILRKELTNGYVVETT
jgi:CheY-like chemotaxis protein